MGVSAIPARLTATLPLRLVIGWFVLGFIGLSAVVSAAPGFPRIANLWGYGPTAKPDQYDKLAKYDLLVMGGAGTDAWRKFAQEMHRRNPEMLLLGTGLFSYTSPPQATPWMKEAWYLHRPNGELVNWWAGQCFVPNILLDDCFAALFDQSDKSFGSLLRDGSLDGVFYDSVVGSASWLGDVDTGRKGVADKPADVDPKWHARQNQFFDQLRQRWPNMRIMANDIDAGHAPHVNGRLYEGGPLLDRIINGDISPKDAINTLNRWMTTSLQPGITFAIMTHPIGWQGWRVGKGDHVTTPGEVDRVSRDFPRMRTGLCTTLMTDAYYAYDVGTVWYGLPFWYAEYDAPLGKALGPSKEVFDVAPQVVLDWRAGQPADELKLDGDTKATPEGIEGAQTDPASGWQRLFATDPKKVRFEPGHVYQIEADLDLIRKPTVSLQFNLRTGVGGWEHHDKGISHPPADANTWHLDVTVVPDDFDDYAAEWHLCGAGDVRLTRIKVTEINQCYYRREFEGGIAVLNAMPRPVSIDLKGTFRRLKDAAAPAAIVEVDDTASGCECKGAWETVGGEVHCYGDSFRRAAKPGDTCKWTFTAPSADTYTIYASIPGGKGASDAAMYSATTRAGKVNKTLDQRTGDGGWVRLFEVKLAAGERCEVSLLSSGTGATQADAIRAESAARYNDGSEVSKLTLGPLDGAVLVRR
jgi:hypothetical protein